MDNVLNPVTVYTQYRFIARSIGKRVAGGKSQRAHDLMDEAESFLGLLVMESLHKYDPARGPLGAFLYLRIRYHLLTLLKQTTREQQHIEEYKEHRIDVEAGWLRPHSFRHETEQRIKLVTERSGGGI